MKARSIIDHQLARLPQLRAACQTCQGDAELCRAGTPTLDRLPGCSAFTDEGNVKPLPDAAAPGDKRQPWQREAA